MRYVLAIWDSLALTDGNNDQITLRRGWVSSVAAQPVADLAAVQIDVRQGDPFLTAPVRASVSCGWPTLKIGKHTLRLSVRQVTIRVTLVNARIKSGSVRHIPVQQGEFRTTTEDGKIEKTARESNLKGEAGFDPAITSLANPLAAFTAKFGIGAGRKRATETSAGEKAERKEEVLLVFSGGSNAIVIGDERLGDALRADGLLKGEYPRPGKNPDDNPPLFVLIPDNSALPMRITLTAAVSRYHLYPALVGESTELPCAESRITAEAAVKKHGKKTANEQLRAVNDHMETLRARMAADEIQLRASSRQDTIIKDLGLGEDEFAVTSESFEYFSSTWKGDDDHG